MTLGTLINSLGESLRTLRAWSALGLSRYRLASPVFGHFSINAAAGASLVTAISLSAVFGAWLYSSQEHENRTRERIVARSELLLGAVQASLETRLLLLSHLADRWRDEGGIPRGSWEAQAKRICSEFPDIQAIEWADTQFHVRWIHPLEGNEAALNLDLSLEPRRKAALFSSRENGHYMASESLDLVQGGKGFIVFIPIGTGNEFQGFILGVFGITDFFEGVTEFLNRDYFIEVREREDVVFSSHLGDISESAPLAPHEVSLDILGNAWILRMVPKPTLVREQQSDVPLFIAAAGLVVAMLLGGVSFLRLKSHEQNTALRENESKLRVLVDGVPVGLISVDANGLITHMNPEAERQFG